MIPTLSDRALIVLGHLLQNPNGDHHVNTVARTLGLPTAHVTSAFALLVARGWAVRADRGGTGTWLRLTPAGRHEAQQLVEAGDVGIPLRRLDVEDPALADRIRAQHGWPLRHA